MDTLGPFRPHTFCLQLISQSQLTCHPSVQSRRVAREEEGPWGAGQHPSQLCPGIAAALSRPPSHTGPHTKGGVVAH